jgi:uncharacterized protein (TIGR04255 family)
VKAGPNIQMTSPPYKRPPITEAVIEIRLEDSLSDKVVEKIQSRLGKKYERSEKIARKGFKFDAKEKKLAEMAEEFVGYKLTSKDQADIVQIKPNAMACSRLAPYNGWENFEPRARENWEIFRKTAKLTRIQRIGVRYLNRIDIPFKKGHKMDIEEYLTVVPKYPEPDLLTSFRNYTMQVMGPFHVEDFNLIINSNVVKSPLIDHFSIVLDLDLSPQGGIPQKNDKIWEMINQMRDHKNNAFELCITDRTRELFL